MNFNDLDAYRGKSLASGRYRVLQMLVYDYTWHVEDAHSNEVKLMFKVKLGKHLRLLMISTQIKNEFIWHWTLFREGDFYFAVEDSDYYQVHQFIWIGLIYLFSIILNLKDKTKLEITDKSSKHIRFRVRREANS